MAKSEYKCAYSHCLHCGEMVSADSAVKEKNKYYHWDCLQTKNDLNDIRRIYFGYISDKDKPQVVAKVLNDMAFKYGLATDYIKFIICYVASNNKSKNGKIKSPFTLLYLATQGYGIKEKYDNNADWWWEHFNRKGIT